MLSQQQILDLAANKEGDYSTSQLLGAYNTGEIDAVNAPSVPLLSSESGGEQIQKDLARLNEYTQPKTIGGTQYFQQADGSYKAVGGNLAPGSGKTDKESGVKSPFGFNEQGQAIQNPNANGTDAFSPEQLTAAGITDPIGEGLLFDPSRQVYYVSNTAPSETQAKIKGQAQSTQASTALASDESWAMSEMKKAITGVDALLADTLGNIQADYQNRKLQLEQMNNASIGRLQTSGYRYGTTRYSSQLQDQLLSVEERAGIQKLSELATETQTLLIKAKQAAASGKYDSLYKYMSLIDKKKEEQAKTAEALAKAKTDQDKALQDKLKEARDQQEADREQEEYNAENLAYSLYGSELSDDEVATIAEVGGVSPQALLGARQRINLENATKDATVGDLKEWQQAMAMGAIPQGTGFFDYVARKGAAGRKPDVSEDLGGSVSGVVARDSDSIQGGLLNLQDLPTKGGYRASVAAELAKKAQEALKSGDLYGTMKASAGYDKEPSDTFLQSMEKTLSVVSQIGTLQQTISDQKTGPIVGAFRSKNPWDTKAQLIKAELNAIVPNLARGVYGEVGVLTDNDIKQYAKTLPTLTSTEAIRNAILYITLDQIRKNVEIKIRNQANGQRDMSGYADTYRNLNEEVDRVLSAIPQTKKSSATVKIGGKDVPVGATITNKEGKKAKVNADGTLTPL